MSTVCQHMFTNMPIKLFSIEMKNEVGAAVVKELRCTDPAEVMRNHQQVAAAGH